MGELEQMGHRIEQVRLAVDRILDHLEGKEPFKTTNFEAGGWETYEGLAAIRAELDYQWAAF